MIYQMCSESQARDARGGVQLDVGGAETWEHSLRYFSNDFAAAESREHGESSGFMTIAGRFGLTNF